MSTMCDTNNTSAPNMTSVNAQELNDVLNHFKENTYRASDSEGVVRYFINTII